MNDGVTAVVEAQRVDIARRVYEAVSRGDVPGVLDLVAEDVEWTFQGPSAIPFAGTRQGREGVAEFFSTLVQTIEFEQFEPRQFIASGDMVVVLGIERSLARSTGHVLEQEWAHVYTLKNGKIVKGTFFEDTAAFVAALNPN